jgi:heme/copper-type cytochrome/quinol oxidase subunit 2
MITLTTILVIYCLYSVYRVHKDSLAVGKFFAPDETAPYWLIGYTTMLAAVIWGLVYLVLTYLP